MSPLDLGLPSILPGSRWDRDNVSETELLETIEDHYYDSLQTVAWLSRKCRETTPEIWDWMDTASVARDIIRMQDLIEGEGTNVYVRTCKRPTRGADGVATTGACPMAQRWDNILLICSRIAWVESF